MKALVLIGPSRFTYTDVPDPVLRSPRDVLIRVQAASICGSDVHGMDGSTGRRIPPLIMGHEAAGIVEAVGAEVLLFKKGDRVTFDSTIYCGECFHCMRGEVNLCDRRRVLGVSCAEYRQDGAFAEYVVVPDRILYPLGDNLDFVSAAMAEPLAVAAHAARIASPEVGASMVVVGTGLIGLLLLRVLRLHGSGKLIAVDLDPARLKTAERFGADACVQAGPDAASELRRLTGGRGVDLAFEAVGAAAPIRSAVEGLRKGGRLVLVGNLSPTVELPLQLVVTRQLQILGSCAIAGEYPLALELMASGKVDVRALVGAVAPLSEGAAQFARLAAKEPGLLKVVLEP